MSRFWSLAALVVGGIIVADIITHAGQTAQVTNAVGSNVIQPSIRGLLGQG